MRRTKIVCTLGPATDDVEIMKELIRNGLNAARVNFSHGTYETHGEIIKKLKQAREELNAPIPLILDTKGPEIRIKTFENNKIRLEQGDKFTLTTEDVPGTQERVSVTYADLPKDLQRGSRVLIDDGLVELRVESITGSEVHCEVVTGGDISSRKGVNLPGVQVNLPSLTEKDISDLKFGIENDFDYVAASFIRSASDVVKIRKVLEENGGENIQIISKIENQEGVDNIEEILEVSDGIMVARGDLGVEIPPEEVPLVQKALIALANRRGKPVITATQMLESMVKSPRPTRAEANDVANAIFDGSDAIMLSGETAAGDYPVEALQTMVKIASRTEQDINYMSRLKKRGILTNPDITNAIAHATCTTAMDLNASAIITVSNSGRTARMVSKYRPACPIIGCSVNEDVCRKLNMSWGVTPLLVELKHNSDELFDHAVDKAEEMGLIEQGEIVVLTAGVPLGISGTTNMIKVHVAGHILMQGKGLTDKSAAANLCVISSPEELKEKFKEGDIIVARDTSNEMMEQIRLASGLIIENDSADCHGAIAGLSLDLPVLIGAENATQILKSGAFVTLDGKKGIVSCNN